jgi:uncharacterized membrane protein
MSGVAAAQALKDEAAVSQPAIANHQDAALNAFILMELTGFAAWLGLWQLRRIGRTTAAIIGTVLVLSILTVAVVAWAANLGGDIRHPEILGGKYSSPTSTASTAWLTNARVMAFVKGTPWVWPTCESLHFLGMSLMFGVLMVVNFRLLGFLQGMSYASVHRLLPFGILGFAVNMLTGMLFFIGEPHQYTRNAPFQWKVLLLVLAGLNFVVLTVYKGAWTLQEDASPSLSDRLLAGSMLALSVGVMYCGRMLPYLGNAF